MVKDFDDFSDTRNKAWCFHCSRLLGSRNTNREHIPTKSLLTKPYPENLPTVHVCSECNESFSLDEQYFVAFLSAVLSGTTNPDEQRLKAGQSAFKNENLRKRIERAKTGPIYAQREPNTVWEPEGKRIENVIVKNARGHAFFENGEPIFDDPSFVEVFPIPCATEDQISLLLHFSPFATWPEVGSRWMQRLLEEDNFDSDGFYVVQPEFYRFRIDFDQGVTVKSIINEYLATVVAWET
ncbi:HNH endonuclease [Phaeobacter inhibens]|uniref:HNH endonuclease n=1 Tax=Phaeobacter inhibens TaxID=221822 RepID=UPI0021A3D005|nr:HNH endonuclease [Phaeobacter inhibens]UWR51660.1 HNH endonuclease [Phaeobacter inhibens]UWR67224.1 HNH endonuclease [Phaeobacter inhibens]